MTQHIQLLSLSQPQMAYLGSYLELHSLKTIQIKHYAKASQHTNTFHALGTMSTSQTQLASKYTHLT
jgi:hypothetical protein